MTSFINIEFSNISKHYRRRIILEGVNFKLKKGQCTLLRGTDGSGKTTLLRIMAGLEKPDAGTINTGLGEIKWRSYRRALQAKIMYLHQHPYMFDASVRQNIAYALPHGYSAAERDNYIDEALHWADLEALAGVSATTLSGGESQRVALARAWLRAPAVLLLDEPMANMDQESRLRTHTLLRQLKSEGMAIVLTSHDEIQFQTLTDRQLLLKDGKIIADSTQTQAENVSAFPIGQTARHHSA